MVTFTTADDTEDESEGCYRSESCFERLVCAMHSRVLCFIVLLLFVLALILLGILIICNL